MIRIQHAASEEQIDLVREMMRTLLKWHHHQYSNESLLVESYFNAFDFEEELLSLPGRYAPPGGRLLLAYYDGEPAGCVALREVDVKSCELKRMFVYQKFQGKGIGRTLTEILIREARNIGYSEMLLNTSIRQVEAQAFYKKFGFRVTAPYYSLPEDLHDWLVFMKLKL